jgi:tetratricopeptide (TPR) repeat protein
MGDRQGMCWTLNNLGAVTLQQGGFGEARRYFEEALIIGREIGDRQTEGSALSALALLCHSLGDSEIAREHAQQTLHIAREIGDRSTEGEALNHLAHALASLGQMDEATKAYQQGLAIRRELGEQNMAMESLAGLARVAMTQEHVIQAQATIEEILDHLKSSTLDGTYEPMRVYLTCYRVLEANQDPRAAEILATAHNLLQERAAKIEDEEMRRSFLENVPAHRELIEVWEKAGAIS